MSRAHASNSPVTQATTTAADALFTQTAFACSKKITNAYSTSFSLGIRMLAGAYHAPIYGIYGFVRYADEIVDTFHQADKPLLLAEFRQETDKAIRRGISLNPVLHAFAQVVNEYHIEYELVDAFLRSMEMDLGLRQCDQASYAEYIFGSAEAVGLMCLRVFTKGNEAEYRRLYEPARRLGAAFQKVNFLRDMRSDYQDRGRVYFPGVDFEQFDAQAKAAIEADIQADFDAALAGIRQLPRGARLGVYVAYIYYLRLFAKIKRVPPARVQAQRIRVPNGEKLALLAGTYVRYKLKAL
jgi:phytoene/squalene synthetase